jgi:hypothetical protein
MNIDFEDILFRAKRKDNGEWVYGDLYRDPFNGGVFIHELYNIGDIIDVVPETLCRYSGVTIEGESGETVKVWEHDFIEYVDEWHISQGVMKAEVVFEEGAFTAGEDVGRWIGDCWQMRVIGNKFDNPELTD